MEPFWIALGVGLVALAIGWGVGWMTRPGVAYGLAVVGLAGAVWLWLAGRQAQGWDAIGYAIGAVIFLGPASAGFALGGVCEWIRRRRRKE